MILWLLASAWAGCAIEAGEVLQTSAQVELKAQEADQALLHEVACAMDRNRRLELQIGVHTDSQGSGAFNLQKSQARADELRKQLASYGVAKGRMTAVGFGESRPITSNQTAEGRAQNSRVEFRIGPPHPVP